MNGSTEIGEHPKAPHARLGLAPERLPQVPWLLPAVAAFAIVCLGLAAVGLASALSARGTTSGFSSTVIPARPDAQTSSTSATSQAAPAPAAAAPASLSAGSVQSPGLPGVFGGSWAGRPPAQFHGPGAA